MTFPEPLDHGLLLRAIGVRRDGRDVIGEMQVDAHETRWVMTPASPWTPGRYEVIALGILEDLAGNRIGRAFEVDEAHRPASEDDAKVTAVPFTLATRADLPTAPPRCAQPAAWSSDRGDPHARDHRRSGGQEERKSFWFPPDLLTSC